MSRIYLVRHGQASFGAADYDVLSARGAEQARRLGAWLAGRGARLTACFAGPRRRQKDTFTHAQRAAGEGLPALVQTLAHFDEYPAFELLAAGIPFCMERDPAFARLVEEMGDPLTSPRVARIIRRVTESWIAGELEPDGLETFPAFVARVRDGLARVAASLEADAPSADPQAPRAAAIVFTSGGAIAAAVHAALGTAPALLPRVAEVIANASLHEIAWRDGEPTLVSFNQTAHLDDPDLVTYR